MPSTSLGIIVQHSTRNAHTQPKTAGSRQTPEHEIVQSERLSPRVNSLLNTGVVITVLATISANVLYVVQLVTDTGA